MGPPVYPGVSYGAPILGPPMLGKFMKHLIKLL